MKNYILKFKNFKLFLSLVIFSLYILNSPASVSAQVKIGEKFGFGEYNSLGEVTGKLVMPVFSIATAAVVIYFLMGAFKYLKAGANKEEVEGARQIIFHSIIGFMILMIAFFVIQFVLNSLFNIKFSIIGT